ncbi:MAG: hypothetical protein IPK81_24570 [Rhodospirillales bacterium]|nr:MAG: hypothetical protein IPK81_24570 [Rhodospirillales bacterium]
MPITGPTGSSQQPRAGSPSAPKLATEGSKLASDISKVGTLIQTTLAQLEMSLKSAAAMAAPRAEPITALVAKMAFAAILHDASEKAMGSKAFNVEAAVSDLERKLNTLRGVASAISKTAALAAAGVAAAAASSPDAEMAKLKRMIEKRSQMFDALGDVMKAHDQAAKNVIQNMR